MPKLIDYPRTTYTSAWEVADVVDDTGGKCALETRARKLNRKVSGSFKAIVGSAGKFGLLTSKRELLTTTTLFRRIKHAYDKKEEILFHREAFLTPPLFTQLCRKFRQRELPIQMLDVMLIREFGVEEINAPGVAKAFVDGARMVGILDENAIVADIDQLAAQTPPRRELANPAPAANLFRSDEATPPNLPLPLQFAPEDSSDPIPATSAETEPSTPDHPTPVPRQRPLITSAAPVTEDAVASLFGFSEQPGTVDTAKQSTPQTPPPGPASPQPVNPSTPRYLPLATPQPTTGTKSLNAGFSITISGPGIDSQLLIQDEYDLALVQGLLEKIRRQLSA